MLSSNTLRPHHSFLLLISYNYLYDQYTHLFIYTMARKKDKPGTENTVSTCCSWSAADDAIMVCVLQEQKDAGNQLGGGWKKTVWNLVTEMVEKEGIPNGPPKTAMKCSDHYSNVSN